MFKRAIAASLIIFTACIAYAQDDNERYTEGKHYKAIATPLKTSYRDEEIGELMEFFSYSCIHCFRLEAGVERYLAEKPDNIRFTQVPVMFNERQAPEVRAYYVVEVLNLGGSAHKAIFDYINVQRKPLRTDAQFAQFFEQFGLSQDDYMKQAYSFAVNAKVNTSIYLTGKSEITGTPSILVNGKYLIDSGAVGGNEVALYAGQWLVEYLASDVNNQ